MFFSITPENCIYVLLGALFNPLTSFAAVRAHTSGKWRYIVFPLFAVYQSILLYIHHPVMVIPLSVLFPGAVVTVRELHRLVFRSLRASDHEQRTTLINFIKNKEPLLSEFIVLTEETCGFNTMYDVLTSDNVACVDGKLTWRDSVADTKK